jgi:D-beta-D-heptose 7-phosphate kinase/D-beta-D-heptose 1-phosphate adenosyltransferase
MDPLPHADPIAAADLAAAIRRLSRASVLVIGDAMLDRYIYGDVGRISPEAPVPVLNIQRELAVPGGAGNVVRNLGALGAAVAFVSVVGDDHAGAELTGLIGGQPGLEPWLLVQGSRVTTVKTRFVAQGRTLQGHHLLRVDREDTHPVHPKIVERLQRVARDAMAATSVVLLSDYRKGVLSEGIPAQLITLAHQAKRRVVVDTHGPEHARFAGADVIMTSAHDVGLAMVMPVDSDAAVAMAAAGLRARHGFGAVLATRGEDGMTLVDADGTSQVRAEPGEVFDIAGSGDTVVSALTAGLAGGLDLRMAVRVASIAGGVVLGKVGTAVARESELLAAISPPGALRKIVSPEVAAERAERWRRNGWRLGFTYGAFDPLRPGHVHLLEQARGACDRLVASLDADIVLQRRQRSDQALQPEAVRAARLASLPSVDLVVVNEEDTPANLLRALRPDLLADGSGRPPEQVPDAELLREWGGRIMLADLLPEATGD